MIIPLASADLCADPRLADYTSLKDVALRSKLEPERGLYMAESTNVIMRALQIGHSPRSFLMSERWLPQLAPLIREAIGHEDGGEVPMCYVRSPGSTCTGEPSPPCSVRFCPQCPDSSHAPEEVSLRAGS